MLVKLVGLGVRQYLDSRWNCFDAFLVFGSVLDVILSSALEGAGSANAVLQVVRTLRLFRVLRMIRLVRGARSLRVILRTLVYTIPSLGNIAILLLLFLFIFAAMGKELFGGLPQHPHGMGLSEYANFNSFSTAFLTVFRLSTNDSWRVLMQDCVRHSELAGKLFFPAVLIMMNFFFLNLFISVMLENFSDMESDEESSPVCADDFAAFQAHWAIFDPSASSAIPVHDLQTLLLSLEPPLGLSHLADPEFDGSARPDCVRQVHEEVASLGLSVRNNNVHFQEVLFALVDRACGTSTAAEAGSDIRSLQIMRQSIAQVHRKTSRKAKAKSQKELRKESCGSERASGIGSSIRGSVADVKRLVGGRRRSSEDFGVDVRSVQAAMTIQHHWQRHVIRKHVMHTVQHQAMSIASGINREKRGSLQTCVEPVWRAAPDSAASPLARVSRAASNALFGSGGSRSSAPVRTRVSRASLSASQRRANLSILVEGAAPDSPPGRRASARGPRQRGTFDRRSSNPL